MTEVENSASRRVDRTVQPVSSPATCFFLLALVAFSQSACGRTGVFDDPWEDGPADAGGDHRIDTDLPPTSCGDGLVQLPEECDDGDNDDQDECSNDCLLVPDDPCSPCEHDSDCARPIDLCIELLDGSFCGLDCSDGQSCPEGYVCDFILRDGNLDSEQCVPELGVCAGCFDQDGDGYGVGAECFGTDCDDTDPEIHPFADEWCDGIDNDCDRQIDEDALDAVPWYRDSDGDSFGDPLSLVLSCSQPVGYVDNDDDCNDGRADIHPDAVEICDDLDNDCDGENDEGCPPDLIVDTETIELSGDHLYDRVEVFNGGEVRITPFDGEPGRPDTGTPTAGCLSIDARIIVIRVDSGFNANGAGGAGSGLGESGGFGNGLVNTGPGGGGYGGRGGSGDGIDGGTTYGNQNDNAIQPGSNGGEFRIEDFMDEVCGDLRGMISSGGTGGGCVRLSAPTIVISGYVRSDGTHGESATDGTTPDIVDGAGGGSGGGILIDGDLVSIDAQAQLSARGGNGGSGATYDPNSNPNPESSCIGHGAGGGGGGRIKIFGRIIEVAGQVVVSGGAGANGPQSNSPGGQAGTTHIE